MRESEVSGKQEHVRAASCLSQDLLERLVSLCKLNWSLLDSHCSEHRHNIWHSINSYIVQNEVLGTWCLGEIFAIVENRSEHQGLRVLVEAGSFNSHSLMRFGLVNFGAKTR